MPDSARIEELRRRVQKDPASIAFAQLAEEYRRAGRLQEAVETCATGLDRHPGYLSARVTLGRALIELGELGPAQEELKQVLRTAPENLAALRGLADIHHRRGELREALAHYCTALEFAPHDPDLEHLVEEIRGELETSTRSPVVVDGLSFEDVQREFLALSEEQAEVPLGADAAPGPDEPAAAAGPADAQAASPVDAGPSPDAGAIDWVLPSVPASEPEQVAVPDAVPANVPPQDVAALEQWLEAIVADRERRAAKAAGEAD